MRHFWNWVKNDDETRTLYLEGVIAEESWFSDDITPAMFKEELFSGDGPITLHINSPGGVVTAGMAIYDTMQYIRPDVSTICIGSCASMAAVLLTAGEKGKRYALPHASVMIHQPLGGAQGQATDIAIHAKEIIRLRSELNGIIAAHSGQTLKTVMKDTERDNFMTADAALKYGLIDKILTRNELAELNGKSELSKK